MKRKATTVPASLKNINLGAMLRKYDIYEKQKAYREVKAAARPLAKQLLAQRKTKGVTHIDVPNNLETPERFVKFWQKQIHVVEVAEAKFETVVQKYIQYIERGFMASFDTEVTNKKTFAAFVQKDYFSDNQDDLLAKAQIDFTPLLQNVAVLAGNEAQKLLNLDTPYIPFDYNAQIAKNVDRFTKSMIDTDKQHLTGIISNGLQDGKSVPEIRSMIEGSFGDYSKNQATRLTRTEVLRASNQANLDAYEQSGVVEAKQWLTAGATDECEQYEGQIEYLSDSFYSDDSEFADGDPPLHPNCRCVVIPVVEEDHAGQSLWKDESGSIQLTDEDPDTTQTFWRGEGADLASTAKFGTNFFGDGMYVAWDKSQAAEFGDKIFKFANTPIGDAFILHIDNEAQYEALVNGAIKYASKAGISTDVATAIPAYARSLGFKAIGASQTLEPLGGVNIIDKKIAKSLKTAMQSQKAIDSDNEVFNARVRELEDQIDKRTKEYRELKQEKMEDAEYIKELEGLVDARTAEIESGEI